MFFTGVAGCVVIIVALLCKLVLYIRESDSFIEEAAMNYIKANYPQVLEGRKVLAAYSPELQTKDTKEPHSVTALLVEKDGERWIEYSGSKIGIEFVKNKSHDFASVAYPWEKGAELPSKMPISWTKY